MISKTEIFRLRKEFVESTIETLKKDIMSKLPKIPEHWHTREITQFIQDDLNKMNQNKALQNDRLRLRLYEYDTRHNKLL